ncbi:DUF6072 family protein [Terasakiella pusilla]|uniref:DUF6072 family protein n=1 Tax=Terasakiella pusilla TaxID=64973 RepID=UPI003AA81DB0
MSEGVQQISNGVKLVGETLLPGTSLLMDGRVKEGAAHVAVGLAARVLLGPIGWGLVAANSFANSVSNQGLVGMATGLAGDARNALRREAPQQDEAVDPAEQPVEDQKAGTVTKAAPAKA